VTETPTPPVHRSDGEEECRGDDRDRPLDAFLVRQERGAGQARRIGDEVRRERDEDGGRDPDDGLGMFGGQARGARVARARRQRDCNGEPRDRHVREPGDPPVERAPVQAGRGEPVREHEHADAEAAGRQPDGAVVGGAGARARGDDRDGQRAGGDGGHEEQVERRALVDEVQPGARPQHHEQASRQDHWQRQSHPRARGPHGDSIGIPPSNVSDRAVSRMPVRGAR
jgi:hypothetical protein